MFQFDASLEIIRRFINRKRIVRRWSGRVMSLTQVSYVVRFRQEKQFA